ncbi:GntR family transcriptional regulator, partial [Nonomuraea sp. RK-328]|nr:GntR family transcriptional regulator [Nonomuraea sp. RK-328]
VASKTLDGSAGANSTPSREPEKPLYESVRDQLIEQIEAGKFPAGALLPSIRDMSVQFTVSTATTRRVLAELVQAGYARAEGPRGHVSTGPQRTGPSSGAPAVSSGATAGTLRAPTAQVISVDGYLRSSAGAVDVRSEPAPPEIALALRLPDMDTRVLVRRQVSVDGRGVPIELHASYLVASVAENTALASSGVIEGSWLEALARHIGRDVKVSRSYISARHPTDSESAALGLSPASCVLVRVDYTQDEHGEPVECSVTVWPGDSTRVTVDRARQ